jgi:hypothetical protein
MAREDRHYMRDRRLDSGVKPARRRSRGVKESPVRTLLSWLTWLGVFALIAYFFMR